MELIGPVVVVWHVTTHWWRHSIRRSYGNIQVVSDLEFDLGKCFVIIITSLARTSDSNLPHPVCRCPQVWVYNSKIKVGSLTPGFWVYLFYKRCQFSKSSVHPSVDLQLVLRDIASGVVSSGVVPSR